MLFCTSEILKFTVILIVLEKIYAALYLELIAELLGMEFNLSEIRKKLTIPDLSAKKESGERLVMVAVGEVLSAAWAERAGIFRQEPVPPLHQESAGPERAAAGRRRQTRLPPQAWRAGRECRQAGTAGRDPPVDSPGRAGAPRRGTTLGLIALEAQAWARSQAFSGNNAKDAQA